MTFMKKKCSQHVEMTDLVTFSMASANFEAESMVCSWTDVAFEWSELEPLYTRPCIPSCPAKTTHNHRSNKPKLSPRLERNSARCKAR